MLSTVLAMLFTFGSGGSSPTIFETFADPMTLSVSFEDANLSTDTSNWTINDTLGVPDDEVGPMDWSNSGYVVSGGDQHADFAYADLIDGTVGANKGTIVALVYRTGGTNPNRAIFGLGRQAAGEYYPQWRIRIDLNAGEELSFRWTDNWSNDPYVSTDQFLTNSTLLWVIARWDQSTAQSINGTNRHFGVSMASSDGATVTHWAPTVTDSDSMAAAAWNSDVGYGFKIGEGTGNEIRLYHMYIFNRWLTDDELDTLPNGDPSPGNYLTDPDLVAGYLCDAETTATDRSGNGFHLTDTGDTAAYVTNDVPPGYSGTSLYFADDAGWMTRSVEGTDLDINGANDFTIACWYKRDVSTGYKMPVGKWYHTGQYQYCLYSIANDEFGVYVSDDGNYDAAREAKVDTGVDQTGVWWHLTGQWDSTLEELRFYTNGVHATTTDGSSWTPATIHDGTGVFAIGGDETSGSGPWAGGTVDEPAVWDRLLNTDEIYSLFAHGLDGTKGASDGDFTADADTLGAWAMTGDGTASEIDLSGNGNTLTTSDTIDQSTTVPPGYSGYSRYIDEGEGLAIPSTGTELDYSGQTLTVACWFQYRGVDAVQYDMLLGRYDSSSNDRGYAFWTQIGNGPTQMAFPTSHNGSTIVACVGPDIDPDTWYHLAATYDGAYVRLYFDGVEVKSTATTGDLHDSSSDFEIGATTAGSAYDSKGWFDEVIVIGRALTPTEINMLMDDGITGKKGADDQ